MSQKSDGKPRNRRSTMLLVLTLLFGLLYLLFVASGSYGMAGSEPVVVKLLFLLFLVSYAVVWRDERIGGMVFVLWWAGMCGTSACLSPGRIAGLALSWEFRSLSSESCLSSQGTETTKPESQQSEGATNCYETPLPSADGRVGAA